MKKITLFTCYLILWYTCVLATHNREAEITYRHIQGYTYEIKIVTYTKLCSICPDRTYLDSVHLGDDAIALFYRYSFLNLSDSIRTNSYISQHTYPGTGVYRIYFADPNRNEGIVNIPNSVNVPVCIDAYLTVLNPDSYCVNNSAVFKAEPVFAAQVGEPFNYNVTAIDPDHDSLSYELITPRMKLDVPVPGYTLPASSNNYFSLSSHTGHITWDSPVSPGEYNFAVRVNEWRNDTIIGYVMRDFQVKVEMSNALTGFVPLTLSTDASGNYFVSVNPGDTVTVQAAYYTDSSNTPNISTYGEAFQMSNPPTVQYLISAGTGGADFQWIPDTAKARLHPYVFSFRGKGDFKSDISFLVYVNGTAADTCPDFTLPPEWIPLPFQNYDMHLYPSMVNESFTIVLNRSVEEVSDKIKMFDAMGRIVRIIDVTSPIMTIHKGTLRKGIYFIMLMNGQDKILIYKKIFVY